jgi:hypothetical protein
VGQSAALIAAYKTLGGSFTGDLTVDPSHKRDLRRNEDPGPPPEPLATLDLSVEKVAKSERTRRIRDAVEAALSDIILLGTEARMAGYGCAWRYYLFYLDALTLQPFRPKSFFREAVHPSGKDDAYAQPDRSWLV